MLRYWLGFGLWRSVGLAVGVGLGLSAASGLAACNGENAGAEAARRQAEAEQAAKGEAHTRPAPRIATPVQGDARVPCAQLIDPAAFQTALGEKAPLTVKDTPRKGASASCALIRGGKRPSEPEQQAMMKATGRLGVLPGDELCNVTALCSTIESTERLAARCKERKDRDDSSLGSYACVHVVAVGAADVEVIELFDEDTRCILQVRGGPSNIDNDQIRTCAKAARDTIGPAQIKLEAGAAGTAGGSAG
jgi:hypothetical protein